MEAASSHADRHAVVGGDLGRAALDQVAGRVAQDRARHVQLLVALQVHEHEVVAVGVEVLHIPAFDEWRAAPPSRRR